MSSASKANDRQQVGNITTKFKWFSIELNTRAIHIAVMTAAPSLFAYTRTSAQATEYGFTFCWCTVHERRVLARRASIKVITSQGHGKMPTPPFLIYKTRFWCVQWYIESNMRVYRTTTTKNGPSRWSFLKIKIIYDDMHAMNFIRSERFVRWMIAANAALAQGQNNCEIHDTH